MPRRAQPDYSPPAADGAWGVGGGRAAPCGARVLARSRGRAGGSGRADAGCATPPPAGPDPPTSVSGGARASGTSGAVGWAGWPGRRGADLRSRWRRRPAGQAFRKRFGRAQCAAPPRACGAVKWRRCGTAAGHAPAVISSTAGLLCRYRVPPRSGRHDAAARPHQKLWHIETQDVSFVGQVLANDHSKTSSTKMNLESMLR